MGNRENGLLQSTELLTNICFIRNFIRIGKIVWVTYSIAKTEKDKWIIGNEIKMNYFWIQIIPPSTKILIFSPQLNIKPTMIMIFESTLPYQIVKSTGLIHLNHLGSWRGKIQLESAEIIYLTFIRIQIHMLTACE